MLPLLLAPAASAVCSEDLYDVGDAEGAGDSLVWPGRAEAPTDTIVVIRRYQDGDVVLLDPQGAEVEALRHELWSGETHWTVLVPLAPLAEGQGYRFETDWSSDSFDVGPGVAELGAPPVPVVRDISSMVTWQDEDCPEEATTTTSVSYRLCDPGVLTLSVQSDTEPPVPTLADVGDAYVSDQEQGSAEGAGPGEGVTVWFGAFDAAGRFTGWRSDAVVMPPAGTRTGERAEGVGGGPTSTPTSISSCPDPVVWVLEAEQTCPVWSVDTRDCASAGLKDDHETTVQGCGCATGGLPSAGWLLGLLLWRRRCG